MKSGGIAKSAHTHLFVNPPSPQARKPYTISKARERWSEEEHQRFVEAVRLHGRAWRKIEGAFRWLGCPGSRHSPDLHRSVASSSLVGC